MSLNSIFFLIYLTLGSLTLVILDLSMNIMLIKSTILLVVVSPIGLFFRVTKTRASINTVNIDVFAIVSTSKIHDSIVNSK